MSINQDKVGEIFEPYKDLIANTIKTALSEYKEKCERIIPDLGLTSRANIISDLVQKKLTAFTELFPKFKTHEQHGSFFIYSDTFALRPKKIDSNHRSGNVKTKRVVAMKEQSCSIPGLENNMVFLTLGYYLEEYTQNLISVFIIAEGPRTNSWEIPIYTEIPSEQMTFAMPIEQKEPIKRVKIKGRKENEAVS